MKKVALLDKGGEQEMPVEDPIREKLSESDWLPSATSPLKAQQFQGSTELGAPLEKGDGPRSSSGVTAGPNWPAPNPNERIGPVRAFTEMRAPAGPGLSDQGLEELGPAFQASAEAAALKANGVRLVAARLAQAEEQARNIRIAAAAQAAEIRRQAGESADQCLQEAENAAAELRAVAEAEVQALRRELSASLEEMRHILIVARGELAPLFERSSPAMAVFERVIATLDRLLVAAGQEAGRQPYDPSASGPTGGHGPRL